MPGRHIFYAQRVMPSPHLPWTLDILRLDIGYSKKRPCTANCTRLQNLRWHRDFGILLSRPESSG
jgi:hypothetical protein